MSEIKTTVVNIDTEPSVKSIQSYRKEIENLTDQLLNLESGTKEYTAVLQKAANMTNELNDITKEVNDSSLDFGAQMGNLATVGAAVTGGMTAATGAMSMFGIESEGTVKAMAKMQNLMGITQGLQAMGDGGVKAFKALKTGIGSAKIGFHGLKGAIAATGIGLLVIALGVVVANFEEIKAALDPGLTNAIEKVKDVFTGVMGVIKNFFKSIGTAIGALLKGDFDGMKAAFAQSINMEGAYLGAIQDKKDEAAAEKAAAQKVLDDAEKEELKKQAGERYKILQEQLKKERELIDKWKREVEDKNRDDQANEELRLQEEYDERLALMTKHGEDTTMLTAQFEQDKLDLADKYKLKQEAADKKAAQDKLDATKKLIDDTIDILEQGYLKEDNKLRQSYIDGNITKEKYEAEQAKVELERAEARVQSLKKLLEDDQLTADQRLLIETTLANAIAALQAKQIKSKESVVVVEKKLDDHRLDNAIKVAGALKGVLDAASNLAEEGSQEQKNLQIASTIVGSIMSAAAAFAGITAKTGGWGIALAAVTAATTLATGFASVKKMAAVPIGDKGASSTPAMPAINFNSASALNDPTLNTNSRNIVGNAEAESGMANQKVYVVESDIKDAGKRVSVAEAENSF